MFKKTAVLLSILLVVLPSLVSAQGVIELLVRNLEKLNFFDALIFLFFSVILFAVLRKSKILGENLVINSIIAIIISFFIFIYPSFTGFSLVMPMSRFFTQISVIILLFVVGFIVASIFYPDMPKMLADQFKTPAILWIVIPIVLALLVTSRMIWVLWAGFSTGPTSDVGIFVAAILIFAVIVLIAAAVGGGGKR